MMRVDTYMSRSSLPYQKPRRPKPVSLGRPLKGTCPNCGTKGISSSRPCPFCHQSPKL